jgi:hypothetical protein
MFGLRGRFMIVVVGVALGAVACGGDNSGSSSSTTAGVPTTTPEEKQSTDAEVTAGLKALPALVEAAVAKVSTGDGTAAFEPIEASWKTYEGTVRAKEQDLYLAIEDGFANLQKAIDAKDAAQAAAAKAAVATAADQYLAKHP